VASSKRTNWRPYSHYYLSNLMDVPDRNNIAEYDVVTDNASIHTAAAVRALVENRGYNCLYLPRLSPLLNPIEEFWPKRKAGIRRTPLSADGQLSDRICESVNK
jgi:hypothetical protein